MRSFLKSLLTPRGVVRAAIAATLALGFVAPAACSSSEDAKCDGYTTPDGRCEKKCDPKVCPVKGSSCLENACSPPCTTNDDCAAGKNCVHAIAATVDHPEGLDAYFCYTPPFAKNDGGIGQFEPCTTSAECDVARGFQCVDGECRIAGCRTHQDCAGIGHCETGGKLYPADPDAGDPGLTVNYCVKGDTFPRGQFGTACPELSTPDCLPDGTCENPMQVCDPKTNKCDDCDKPNGFSCIGSGPGDVDAYCSKTECVSDDDCTTGYFCSNQRTSRPPCADACGFTGQPTNTNCVAAADIGPDKAYSCGKLTLLRNLCLKREYCNECETDADCLALPNQICAKDTKGNKICTVVCDPNLTNACPWGTASICDVWDKDLGVPTCAHRFGACKGTGKSCEPCLDDGDCPNGICLSSDFTGERYCVDLGDSCSCAGLPLTQNAICTGGGCPQTPGNLPMKCYGGPAIDSTNPLYLKCVGANSSSPIGGSPQTGCWPPQ
jgi:hypothetical protein